MMSHKHKFYYLEVSAIKMLFNENVFRFSFESTKISQQRFDSKEINNLFYIKNVAR